MDLREKIEEILANPVPLTKHSTITPQGIDDRIDKILDLFSDYKNEWISVNDRLPEEMRRVLTHHKRGAIRLHRWIAADKEDFTHWQPLPEPPKEG